MKVFVVGFPKSGTTTLTVALRASGLNAAHWHDDAGVFVGSAMYAGLFSSGDPFDRLTRYDAITQADVCIPQLRMNFWPNLDFAMLRTIRALHPGCLFLLNYRRPEAICESIMRWKGMWARLTVSDIPGLPREFGTRAHLIGWIENHFAACRSYFANDPHFLEIDIESAEAPIALGRALGITIKGWGDHKPSELDPEAAHIVSS